MSIFMARAALSFLLFFGLCCLAPLLDFVKLLLELLELPLQLGVFLSEGFLACMCSFLPEVFLLIHQGLRNQASSDHCLAVIFAGRLVRSDITFIC